jgi:zinc and cadmium transporter
VTWLAAAAHEVPQELGDFAILVHGGWSRRRALVANFVSALTIVPGGALAWVMGQELNVLFLLPFAAGNFVYIAASDLIPEMKHATRPGERTLHFFAFMIGILLLLAVRLAF